MALKSSTLSTPEKDRNVDGIVIHVSSKEKNDIEKVSFTQKIQ